jgi:hypothetical protein
MDGLTKDRIGGVMPRVTRRTGQDERELENPRL